MAPPSTDTAALQQALRDLPRIGTILKDRPSRQIWRFDFNHQTYFLKFHPRRFTFKRLFRGSPAMVEFHGLQELQRAGIPAPRAVAVLMGFRLGSRIGDAVISQAIEPAVQLDRYLHPFDLAATPIPHRRQLAAALINLVHSLAQARLGHADLHLGNFLIQHSGPDVKLFLLDGYAVHRGGLKRSEILRLGHSVMRYATTGDLMRGWELLGDARPLPRRNPISQTIWRTFQHRLACEDEYFGRLDRLAGGSWSGVFAKQYKYPYRWSLLSQLNITRDDWLQQWPILLEMIQSSKLEILKQSRSGDVLATTLTLGGRDVNLVVNRPRRRYWYRYLNEIGRGGRARRAWHKAWRLVIRNLPTAWPVLLMEKRRCGYVTDAVVVFERVPGPTLANVDLDALPPDQRDMLFRRTGRILRRIDNLGWAHFDAKASNWIVLADTQRGPTPVIIDPDSIRRRRWSALGIRRLLRSMREHPQYTPDDSLALCQGYAPRACFIAPDAQK